MSLSRNLYFYNELKLKDTFETRVYLMFFHFSVMMIIFKKKGSKFDQNSYDSFFQNIENNLREMGFGDVSVNKKMKDLNKILYDILLKIFIENDQNIQINEKLILKYFRDLDKDEKNSTKLIDLLGQINRDFNQSIVITTHNPEIASIGNKQYKLEEGLLNRL